MIVNYGYADASGEFFIAIDTNQCNGCGACVVACTRAVLEVAANPWDPMDERSVAGVTEAQRRRIREACAECKSRPGSWELPCVSACSGGAIEHSW